MPPFASGEVLALVIFCLGLNCYMLAEGHPSAILPSRRRSRRLIRTVGLRLPAVGMNRTDTLHQAVTLHIINHFLYPFIFDH